MNISIEFNKTPKYLVAKVSGRWLTTDALESIEAIKNEANTQKINHILLDLQDLSLPDNEMTRFFSGEKISNAFDYSFKIAAYSQREKINRFAETVAVNRGANFKVFDCESDAINWLQS
ncbi:MAG: hypothetical protein PHC28_17805 [Flavobacterium sp.]|uniref:hypothetical protein n=1 Tax=Flavobacterium sp. TaxID=239 RepID=UPI0026304829|nr:hypothetical protein [Flavobacterium sp.]MDD5152302.1 hypothetical protein [Flavobacterium sp.]